MTAQFPDPETIWTALSLAIRAPSVHNSQPWRWEVGDRSLHLYADTTRHLSHADPDRRDLLVSCGASLHHATVALAALGWQSKVRRLPNPADPSHLASIHASRYEPSDVDVSLAAAIPRRRTDRRLFSYWPVPRADIATIGARAARMGVRLRHVEMTTDIKAIVAQSMRQHLQDAEYLTELTRWSGRYGSTAGVPARNSPDFEPTAPLPGRIFAGTALAQPAGATVAADHAVLVALGTSADDDVDRLRAGEATSMALLTSTCLGLSSCPVTEPLEIAETREAIRSEVFGGTDYPQMMLRIGWAPVGADPLPSTPRRPLNEVIITR
ncbi:MULTISPECIES: Acg family FMN-binding oxidoreductase [unclassified Mycobacterium]|uniref:Acg family FMN-binding oxidoreductase n=1 Tax=unclassified Mycobacterium TaxID=2642494 RepID=UPI0029C94A6F|nr:MULTISPECIES: NAD(P)H nitroreductase [unclassified Mycobacterium]